MSNSQKLENQDERYERKQGRPEQGFIPGLPSDIVMEHIATRLPWVSMFALTLVNRAWRRAIRSREIYKMRKRCEASQVMVVAPVEMSVHKGFFDVESQDVFLFPPPGFLEDAQADPPPDELLCSVPMQGCLPSDEKVYSAEGIIFLNGKLYALQESLFLLGPTGEGKQEVLELDVAACDREWRHCSSSSTHCYTDIWVACNGKIYSFHTCGTRFHGKVFNPCSYQWAEIEDRPVNVWPPLGDRQSIADSQHPRDYRGRVAVLGTKIYVGCTWGSEMMVFDTVTEIWRMIPNTLLSSSGRANVFA